MRVSVLIRRGTQREISFSLHMHSPRKGYVSTKKGQELNLPGTESTGILILIVFHLQNYEN